MEYINIDTTSDNVAGKIKQKLKRRTGNFVWRIKFNVPLDPSSITSENLYVTKTDGNKIPASIHYEPLTHEIEIEPAEAYVEDSSYLLCISKSVRSAGGQQLKNDAVLRFNV